MFLIKGFVVAVDDNNKFLMNNTSGHNVKRCGGEGTTWSILMVDSPATTSVVEGGMTCEEDRGAQPMKLPKGPSD